MYVCMNVCVGFCVLLCVCVFVFFCVCGGGGGLSKQRLFKEVTCWIFSPSVCPRYSLLHGLLKKAGACLWEGILEVRKELSTEAGPATVPLKTYRSPNRQRQAAVFGRAAAAAAAARCCLWPTARASAVESTDTTRTRGWISRPPGPMTTLSCRDSENRELPLRLRTWKTSWRWTALPWRSVCPIRQAWSTGKREAEPDRPGREAENQQPEQIFAGGSADTRDWLNRCAQLNRAALEWQLASKTKEISTNVYPDFFANFSTVFSPSSD